LKDKCKTFQPACTGKKWLSLELPVMEYREAWDLQTQLVHAKRDRIIDEDVVLLLEHLPVFTLGRQGNREHLLVTEAFLRSRQIPVVHVERGGDITYHGPGQLVVYPIVNLRTGRWRVVEFVEALEEVMIRTTSDWGITAKRNAINRGVWIGSKKNLGNIGIAVRRGMSFHGFAFNVNIALEPFSWIDPCGLKDVKVTSMKKVLGGEIAMGDIRQAVSFHVQEIFGVQLEHVSLEHIHRLLGFQENRLEMKAI